MRFLLEFTLYNWTDYFIKSFIYVIITFMLFYFAHLIFSNLQKSKLSEKYYGDLNLLHNFSRMISSMFVLILVLFFWFYSLYFNGIDLLNFSSFKIGLSNSYLILTPYFYSFLLCALIFNKSKSNVISKF